MEQFQLRWNKHIKLISPNEYNYKTWTECEVLILKGLEEYIAVH